MKREDLLEEVWREQIKDDILSCVVMKEEKELRGDCRTQCDAFHICVKVFQMEMEE